MAGNIVLQTLRHAWLTLEDADVPAALMGGLALAAWKHIRATRDVDLLVSARKNNLDALLKTLADAGIRPKRTPPVVSLGQLQIVQLAYEPPEAFMDLQVDLLLANSDYHQHALERRIPARLPDLDIEIAVLQCEDLILHKLLAARLIDRVDAATLLRANRQSLDMVYIADWAKRLEIIPEWTETWQEAFPDEPRP